MFLSALDCECGVTIRVGPWLDFPETMDCNLEFSAKQTLPFPYAVFGWDIIPLSQK